ncbi:tRNA (guanosine(37)-N1)-methyltransferase TrmD [Paenibacillus sp. ACRRX]|uniref:tRNA (guanosine(37)-N1)-methyltransferase TrmD n=1 Tax=Paenibacillus sp. ACRRX TaxID=2918206 RepID=UPI001EF6187F|nr:tRNA (guanosine(37)-N1)-methyltransferase TrmD [Paenibacillus sp. ACRRX]MCG7407523.1 tRNA (guanosine(37)-N1)-methyltransferase TrmD [Paenibacillus sp. ACRRX]
MRIDVLTLFPEMCEGVFSTSIMGRAREKGLVQLQATNFRQFSTNKHSTVDDYPYGGGGGMVLKPEPIFAAVEHLMELTSMQPAQESTLLTDVQVSAASGIPEQDMSRDAGMKLRETGIDDSCHEDQVHSSSKAASPRIILMCPQGETFTQAKAEELAQEEHLIFICGHYEGYDERIREHLVTDELSIGDYVLTGGELPAMVIADAVVRLLPGVLGNESSAVTDSFSTGLLEYPHYTRPVEYRGWQVPDVLISGHHANVDKWRREQSLRRTWERRPDLLNKVELSAKERKWLQELKLQAVEARKD